MQRLVEQHFPAFRDLRARMVRPLPDKVSVENHGLIQGRN
jgi:hypothetical protein